MYQNNTFILLTILIIYIAGSKSETSINKIACGEKNLKLECRRREILTILSANYGRTSPSICIRNDETNCRSSEALKIVKSRCDGKLSCTVPATNAVFGEPCHGVEKYLEVNYKCTPAPTCSDNHFQCYDGRCIDKNTAVCNGVRDCPEGEDEIGCNYITSYGCEGGSLSVQCGLGEIIRVVNGNYGRTNEAICSGPIKTTNCSSPVAAQILKEKCDLKRECSVLVSHEIFGDPCEGTKKYIELNYFCWQIPIFK